MKARRKAAVRCTKLVYKIIRNTGQGNGTSLPGCAARLLAPEILADLSGMVREKTIVTMGTNGKTTSNNLMCKALEDAGKKVVCNRLGANMPNGIITAYALAAAADGSLDADYACLEVDELAAASVLPLLKPDCILLTNIFRDQLDRYGEPDLICQKLKAAIDSVPDAVLVINGDDIFSCTLAGECRNPRIIYGINEAAFAQDDAAGTCDSLFCRSCGHRLTYLFHHYGHLGVYHCPGCGMSRPLPAYTASDICFDADACSFSLNGYRMTARIRTAYSIYNTLSAYAALCGAGADTAHFAEAVRDFDYGNNREAEFLINDTLIRLYLIKNPIGLQLKFALLQKDPAPKDILLLINDNAQDGMDVSWLWDVDFGSLHTANTASVIAAGLRRYDVELRLKYEEIPCRVSNDPEASVEALLESGSKNLYILVNYSGLYRTKRMLQNLANAREGGTQA